MVPPRVEGSIRIDIQRVWMIRHNTKFLRLHFEPFASKRLFLVACIPILGMKLKQVRFFPIWQRISFPCFAFSCFETLRPDMGTAASKSGVHTPVSGCGAIRWRLMRFLAYYFFLFFLLLTNSSSFQQTISSYTF